MKQEALTRANLADAIGKRVQLSKIESADLVNQFFELVSDALINGNDVKLSNFGSFKLRNKKTRIGRNPKTLEKVVIASRTVVTFAPSTSLKQTLSDGRKKKAEPR